MLKVQQLVTEGTTDRVGVTLAIIGENEANPLFLVRWIEPGIPAEWIRSEYLYSAE